MDFGICHTYSIIIVGSDLSDDVQAEVEGTNELEESSE